MEIWEIIIYALTQGITEFLPISSSAHLFIIEYLLNMPISGRTMAIAAHLGSLLAVCTYLRKDLIKICYSVIKFKNHKKDNNLIFIQNLFIITIPILIVGFFIFKILDKELLSLKIIAWSSIIGATLLYIADNYRVEKKSIYSLSFMHSLFIGCFQVFALIPGASRAGTVITAGRILGLSRIESTKLGLYSGLPTIMGAVILETTWLLNKPINQQQDVRNK